MQIYLPVFPAWATLSGDARARKLLHSPILVYYQIDEDKGLIEVLPARSAKAANFLHMRHQLRH